MGERGGRESRGPLKVEKSERKKQRCVRQRRIETRRNKKERDGGKETKGDCHSRGNKSHVWVGSYLWGISKHQAFIKCIGHSLATKQTPLPLPDASVPSISLFLSLFFSVYFLLSISAGAYRGITKIRELSRNSAPLNLPCISRVLPT